MSQKGRRGERNVLLIIPPPQAVDEIFTLVLSGRRRNIRFL